MVVKSIVDEDFVNYKKASMFIGMPRCNFKCEKECGQRVCQNSILATSPDIVISKYNLCKRYLLNHITQSIVFGGLEPMDSFRDLCSFIYTIRFEYQCQDDIVIYTGYTKEECEQNNWISELLPFKNIIIKFGRYVPNQQSHYDPILGVNLASENQYAERIN